MEEIIKNMTLFLAQKQPLCKRWWLLYNKTEHNERWLRVRLFRIIRVLA